MQHVNYGRKMSRHWSLTPAVLLTPLKAITRSSLALQTMLFLKNMSVIVIILQQYLKLSVFVILRDDCVFMNITSYMEINGVKAFTCSCSAVTQTSVSFILMYKTEGLFSMNMISDSVWLNQFTLYKNYKKRKEKLL